MANGPIDLDELEFEDERLTPAEFRAARTSLGLTLEWLASRWHESAENLQHWDTADRLPERYGDDLRVIEAEAEQRVAVGRGDDDEELRVPRDDASSPDEFPAPFHWLIAWQVTSETGARIRFSDEPQDSEDDL